MSNSRRRFAFSRRVSPEFCFICRAQKTRAQERPGAGWHPRSVRDRNAHGVDHRCCRSPGLPCANGFNGVLRALLGERCTIAPVGLRMADVRVRSDRRITASLDAQTPGVGTTRLLPSAHVLACRFEGWRVLAPEAMRRRCQRRVVRAMVVAHSRSRPTMPDCARRRRVHRSPACGS